MSPVNSLFHFGTSLLNNAIDLCLNEQPRTIGVIIPASVDCRPFKTIRHSKVSKLYLFLLVNQRRDEENYVGYAAERESGDHIFIFPEPPCPLDR